MKLKEKIMYIKDFIGTMKINNKYCLNVEKYSELVKKIRKLNRESLEMNKEILNLKIEIKNIIDEKESIINDLKETNFKLSCSNGGYKSQLNKIKELREIDINNLNESHKIIRKMKQEIIANEKIRIENKTLKEELEIKTKEINNLKYQIKMLQEDNKNYFDNIKKEIKISELENYKMTGKRNLKKCKK